jgi:hypothetical protein
MINLHQVCTDLGVRVASLAALTHTKSRELWERVQTDRSNAPDRNFDSSHFCSGRFSQKRSEKTVPNAPNLWAFSGHVFRVCAIPRGSQSILAVDAAVRVLYRADKICSPAFGANLQDLQATGKETSSSQRGLQQWILSWSSSTWGQYS